MNAAYPIITGIGGSHSSVGKTALAAAIISHLTSSDPAIKIGAIKFSREACSPVIVDDPLLLSEKGKDTARLLEAGAAMVLWIKGPSDEISDMLDKALGMMCEMDLIVVEGNSAVMQAGADIIIFVSGQAGSETKPGALELKEMADIIVTPVDSDESENKIFMKGFPEVISRDEIGVIIGHMENTAKKNEIITMLTSRAKEGRLTCTEARAIASELKTTNAEVGAAADELRIKIKNCELGCF